MSQGTDRTCTECGRTFRGQTRKCSRCQGAERKCVSCGVTIISRFRKCRSCRTLATKPNPCEFPGCDNPKTHTQGARYCSEHRDGSYQRVLERLRKKTCAMPGCEQPKLAIANLAGRQRPFRYCAEHSVAANKGSPEYRRRVSIQNARRKREREFGITHEQYLAMLDAQDGVCAICGNGNGNARQLSVDHDHVTGAVRSLLCDRCNPLLGYAHDDIAILEAAIEYLKMHKRAGQVFKPRGV